MADTYNIGNSTAQIFLEADITSIGLCASRASVKVVGGADAGTAVAHSNDASGGISPQSIGDYSLLKGKRLLVFTKIALTGDDAAARAAQVDSILGSYTLSGGDDNQQEYNDPINNYIDPNVFLTITIDLT